VDFTKRQLCIQRSEWRGHVTVPKGERLRYVPMTSRLTAALRERRHLKSQRVLCQSDGSPQTQDAVGDHVRRAAGKARVAIGGPHRLRHTFCSHLAMRGAPGRAIQDLAGHQDLITTQRYMHLTPAVLDAAIRLLESPGVSLDRGDIVETADRDLAKALCLVLLNWRGRRESSPFAVKSATD
jgi:integrase